jgi:hypothetical protein
MMLSNGSIVGQDLSNGHKVGMDFNDWGVSNSAELYMPGSGGNWSDGMRSVYGNYMMMGPTVFQNYYGILRDDYNNSIVPNYRALPKTRSDFQQKSSGERGFYGESRARVTSYSISAADENGNSNGTINMDVISEWVSLGAQDGGGYNLGTGLSAFDFAIADYSQYVHNHTTYTTTKGIIKNIFKANGEIRSARAARFANASRMVRGVAVIGSVLSTGYSTLQVYDQWDDGGIQNVNGWDATDAGVGLLGLGATGLAYFGLISNPVGWAIGAGVLIYSGSRLAYDLYNKP